MSPDNTGDNKCTHFLNFLYLIFPIVTFALLSTHPWLPDGLLCDTRQPKTPCVWSQEFPVLASIAAGFEIVTCVLIALYNTTMHTNDGNKSQSRWAFLARGFVFLIYFVLYMTVIVYLIEAPSAVGRTDPMAAGVTSSVLLGASPSSARL